MGKRAKSRDERKERSLHSRLDKLESKMKALQKEYNEDLVRMSNLGYQVILENAALRNLLFGHRFIRSFLRITNAKFRAEMERVGRQIRMNQRMAQERATREMEEAKLKQAVKRAKAEAKSKEQRMELDIPKNECEERKVEQKVDEPAPTKLTGEEVTEEESSEQESDDVGAGSHVDLIEEDIANTMG